MQWVILFQSLAKEGGGGSKHLGKDGNPRKVRLTPAGAGEQASSSSSGLKKPEKKRANKSDLEKSTKGLENPKKRAWKSPQAQAWKSPQSLLSLWTGTTPFLWVIQSQWRTSPAWKSCVPPAM